MSMTYSYDFGGVGNRDGNGNQTDAGKASLGVNTGYAAGTRIMTIAGEMHVETLRPGSRVVTLNGFGLTTVKSIGQRHIETACHPRQEAVLPIRVRAHAFAPGRPHHDLLLSPDHAVFVDGVLIPARCLINGATVTQEVVDCLSYHLVAVEQHDILLAEGMPAETCLDTGHRAGFANRDGSGQAYPAFVRGIWGGQSCAPRVIDGFVLEGVRADLLTRARDLGM